MAETEASLAFGSVAGEAPDIGDGWDDVPPSIILHRGYHVLGVVDSGARSVLPSDGVSSVEATTLG